jgi:type I restriction enzyme M protein
MNKQELATRIWATANELRKNIKASEYKDYILGFMFYKYLCDKEIDYLTSLDGELEDLKDADEVTMQKFKDGIGYFIAYDNLFSTWKPKNNLKAVAHTKAIGAAEVTVALDAFYRNLNEQYKQVFENVFAPLQTGLNKLGENAGSRDEAVRSIVDMIDMIPSTSKDYDVLGYIYEYLIQQFSSEAKKDGAFYTPHELTSLMARIIAERMKNRTELTVYDPCVGSGGLLLNIGREAEKYINPDDIHYYGQELISETCNLTKMNLFMQGIPIQNMCIRNGNTLAEDWPYFDETTQYSPLSVDAVTANPPYSANWDPNKHQSNERFNKYGFAPKGKADYAFLLHCLFHIKKDGIMAIVLPHGVLFRGGNERDIRKNLVDSHNIETIIGFPPQMFFSTGIPVIVMILSKNRSADDILFVDASKSFVKGKKQNVLRESDVQRIFDAVEDRKDIPYFARLVSKQEIVNNDYNLNIPRYISAEKKVAPYDIYSVMTGQILNTELNEFNSFWSAFPALQKKIFKDTREYPGKYLEFKDVDVKTTVFEDKDVQLFQNQFGLTTKSFKKYLISELIDQQADMSIRHQITEKLFSTYDNKLLIDKYNVYQAFSENWDVVDSDISRILEEGKTICKETEPNMITKKNSKSKTTEDVQDGWKGKIMPFELIKSVFFEKELKNAENIRSKAEGKKSEYNEVWEEMDEDVKPNLSKEDKEGEFDSKKIKAAAKANELDDDIIKSLKVMLKAMDDEKALNKEAKGIDAELEDQAKDKIIELTDEEVNDLLIMKWIDPIIEAIMGVEQTVLNSFVIGLETLKKKYSDPLDELNDSLHTTENGLMKMLDDLTGCDSDMDAINLLKEALK